MANRVWKRSRNWDGTMVYRLFEGSIAVASTFKAAGFWIVAGPRVPTYAKGTYCTRLADAKRRIEGEA
jgi:hypothetical protein